METTGSILEAVAQLGAQLNARLDGIDARLDGIDARLDAIEARLDRLEQRVSRLEAQMGETRDELADVRRRFESLPNLNYMFEATKALMDRLRVLEDSMVDIRTRLAEIFGAMATDSEIGVLREEIVNFRSRTFAMEVRVNTLERQAGTDTKGFWEELATFLDDRPLDGAPDREPGQPGLPATDRRFDRGFRRPPRGRARLTSDPLSPDGSPQRP